jgi:hypothetical protein
VALPAWLLLAAGVAVALLLGRLLWWPGRLRPVEVAAAVLVAYPVARALVGAASVSDRLTRYTVLLPASALEFQLAIARDLGFGILLPLGGALLLWRTRAGRGEARGWRDAIAGALRALEPAGVRPDARPARAVGEGLALLAVVLALQALALAAQATVARFLVTGDESAYWINLTPALLLGLSVAAGVSEEFVWRGLLLRALLRRLGWWPALLAQAALFGFIHAGYGNWAHVLGPAIFGLLMGLVALRVSLLAAVLVHAGVDIAYLALAAPHLQPAILVLPGLLVAAGAAALLATRGAPIKALWPPWRAAVRA